MSRFQKATKTKSLLRMALFGPSGAGKTYSALSIASGIAEVLKSRVAVIDTENGSASKYADRFDFDALDLDSHTVFAYRDAINEAAQEGYKVLVIDSLSHGWRQLIEEVEKLAKAKYNNNTFSAWSEGTPMQKELVKTILEFPGHIIATMRAKMEYTLEKDERTGKSKPQKHGLAPEQGKGIEYEFDLVAEVNLEHWMMVSKDRTGKFQDRPVEKPGAEFGKELIGWLNEGAERKPKLPDFSKALTKTKKALKEEPGKIPAMKDFWSEWKDHAPEVIYEEATRLIHEYEQSLRDRVNQEGAA